MLHVVGCQQISCINTFIYLMNRYTNSMTLIQRPHIWIDSPASWQSSRVDIDDVHLVDMMRFEDILELFEVCLIFIVWMAFLFYVTRELIV